MCEPTQGTRTDDSAKICKEFVDKYYHISNTRPDLLYRLYKHNATLSVAETMKSKQKNISAVGSNHHEIRFLLTYIFDKVRPTIINISFQHSMRDHLLLMVNGLLYQKATRPGHFFTQTFLLDFRSRIAVASDVLQIFSHNLKRNLIGDIKTKLKQSKVPVGATQPPVVDKTIRSRVYKTVPMFGSVDEVATLFVLQNDKPSAALQRTITMKRENECAKEQCLEPDTARESASETLRTHGWDAFSEKKPMIGAAESENLYGPPLHFAKSEEKRTYLDTPLTNEAHAEKGSTKDGLFLTCFGEGREQRNMKAELLRKHEWNLPPKETKTNGGAYLRLFGFQPIPDGPPVEWDLSQDAVLTQLRTYQEVVDRMGMPVPKRRSRSMRPQVEWYHRTVYLDNLPRDVHPESLRRAYETMFGEIEEENGIILASARKSSVAYLVFKSLESAIAVGRADSWINGSKIVIQKYRMPQVDVDSHES